MAEQSFPGTRSWLDKLVNYDAMVEALEDAKTHLEAELGEWLPIDLGELPSGRLQQASILHDTITSVLAKAKGGTDMSADDILRNEG